MHPTNADFGRRLASTRTPATGWFAWVAAGVLLITLAAFILVPAAATRQCRQFLPKSQYVPWAAAGLGVLSFGLGVRRRGRRRSAQDFHEAGAYSQHGGRTVGLAYANAEGVTFVVRPVGTHVERSLTFTGPGRRPAFSLGTDLADDEAGDDHTPSARAVENVATAVIRAAAGRMVEHVDRGDVVHWTAKLWLDQAGLRVGDSEVGRVVPWNVVDGVKDGSKSGVIEVYAFGVEQPVATAKTTDINALPGFHAFMELLARGQAAARAA